jgi:hypothetical protein
MLGSQSLIFWNLQAFDDQKPNKTLQRTRKQRGPAEFPVRQDMVLTNTWKQSGRISLWRYTENERNYPGWHLSADVAGCQSLLALLEALATDGGGFRTITITTPDKAQLLVPNNKSGLAAWVAPTKLQMELSPNPTEWAFPPDMDPAAITVGSNWLAPLREGIAGIAKGRGDYAIGDRKNGSFRLWFWW